MQVKGGNIGAFGAVRTVWVLSRCFTAAFSGAGPGASPFCSLGPVEALIVSAHPARPVRSTCDR